MSTLIENVAKVEAAHAALKDAIAAKGVTVPEGTKLTGMPALVAQIQTTPEQTNVRACFAADDLAGSLVVPKTMVVDMLTTTNLRYFFYNCRAMTSLVLPTGFGQNATTLYNCFFQCGSLTSLTLPDGFGQAAADLANCFFQCGSLTSLTLPDGFGQAAADLGSCFHDCVKLTSLTLPDGFGQNATTLYNCFYNCRAMTSLVLPTGFGQNATNNTNCFHNCSALTDITGNPNFKASLNLSTSPRMTHDSLMVVINGLQTVPTAQTLTLGTTNLAKLTDEERKVATDKGWTLA